MSEFPVMYIKKVLKGDVITLCNADVAMVSLPDTEKYLVRLGTRGVGYCFILFFPSDI